MSKALHARAYSKKKDVTKRNQDIIIIIIIMFQIVIVVTFLVTLGYTRLRFDIML